MTKLPEKASDMIRLALKDLEAVEKSSDYRINMVEWHRPMESQRGVECHVCMAGAVMAQTMREPAGYNVVPSRSQYGWKISNKISALNEFRLGRVFGGLSMFHSHELDLKRSEFEKLMPSRSHVELYQDDSEKFKSDMLDMANHLEQAGY